MKEDFVEEDLIDENWWKITLFSEKVSNYIEEKYNDGKGIHQNTVNNWFKSMEAKGVHYITRSRTGEKVYNLIDFEIGCFIADQKRNKAIHLSEIFDNVKIKFAVRPFPGSFKKDTMPTVPEIEEAMEEIEALKELNKQTEQKFQKMFQGLEERLTMGLKQLPAPIDKEKERSIRMDDFLTRVNIEQKLEREAIKEWDKLPESEKLRKVGWFRKDVDMIKREAFIREYKMNNLKNALEESFDLEAK
jgi:mRNA-degrading endonuclease RelE of RelBE toxin-antitoxin system